MRQVQFIHIPKTAGQSVHNMLLDVFGESSVCPHRVNSQIEKIDHLDLKKYKVISGHFDCLTLQSVNSSAFRFTILREPVERILSYYFYLSSKASKMSSIDLDKSENIGLKAVKSMSPNDYFCDAEGEIRNFVDDHYDNFYMYFFASGKFNGRRQLVRKRMSQISIFKSAIIGMMEYDSVYTIENWFKVGSQLKKLYPEIENIKTDYFTNKGDDSSTEKRLDMLLSKKGSDKVYARINEMTQYDQSLYQLSLTMSSIS